jgi:outer membrane protein
VRGPGEGSENPLNLGVRLGALALGALLLVPGGGVEAQERRVLSLDNALSKAQQYNPDYRMAQNELELSQTGKREAWGAFLPDLSLRAGTGLSFDRQLIATDFFGNPIENPETEWQTSSSAFQNLGGSIMLFQGGQRFSELSEQGAQAKVRDATVSARLRTVRGEVVRTYLRAQAQQAYLGVEEDLLEARHQDLAMNERMFDLAGATRVEVLAAELNLQRQEQRIQETLAQLRQNVLTLQRIIGDPELEDFGLSANAPEPMDPQRLDAEDLVARALASNPLIHQQSAQMDVGSAQAKSARGSRWPTVSLSYGFNQRTFAQDNNALFDMYPDQSRYGTTSLNLSIPIFSRFQNSARIAEAQVSLDNAEENLRKTRLQVEENVRSQLIGLQTAYRGYGIAIRSREIAQERLLLAQEQFRSASRTFSDLQQDIAAASTAEREVITQLFGYLEARVNLEETVGELALGGGA